MRLNKSDDVIWIGPSSLTNVFIVLLAALVIAFANYTYHVGIRAGWLDRIKSKMHLTIILWQKINSLNYSIKR